LKAQGEPGLGTGLKGRKCCLKEAGDVSLCMKEKSGGKNRRVRLLLYRPRARYAVGVLVFSVESMLS